MSDHWAPALAAAGRSLVAAMMVKVAARGFTDMTPAFASLLPLLDSSGAGMRAQVLAERSGVTKQAMSQLLRELLARGYVEQVPDPTDTRAKLVRLTQLGIGLRAACEQSRHEITAAALDVLGAARLKRLQKDLLDLSSALDGIAR